MYVLYPLRALLYHCFDRLSPWSYLAPGAGALFRRSPQNWLRHCDIDTSSPAAKTRLLSLTPHGYLHPVQTQSPTVHCSGETSNHEQPYLLRSLYFPLFSLLVSRSLSFRARVAFLLSYLLRNVYGFIVAT